MIAARPKTIPAGQLGPFVLEQQPDEERDRGEAHERQRVRDLAHWCRDSRGAPCLASLGVVVASSLVTAPIPLAGFVNSHSHAFQRALRGRAAGTDFWTWRDGMLEEADRATPDSVREHYADVYREMRAAGYTAVGEFHYLGAAEAFAAAEAAEEAGIAIVLLHVAYERGGLDRMRQGSVAAYLDEVESLRAAGIAVGIAPHSVRACSRGWLAEIGRYAAPRAAATPHPRRRAAA